MKGMVSARALSGVLVPIVFPSHLLCSCCSSLWPTYYRPTVKNPLLVLDIMQRGFCHCNNSKAFLLLSRRLSHWPLVPHADVSIQPLLHAGLPPITCLFHQDVASDSLAARAMLEPSITPDYFSLHRTSLLSPVKVSNE